MAKTNEREKTNFVSSRKQPHVPPAYNFQYCLNAETSNQAFNRTRITRGKREEKPFRQIQAYSGIFRHVQAYSETIRYIQTFSDIFTTLHNLGILRTLVYSEPETYSEPCQIATVQGFSKIVNGYNNRNKYLDKFFRNISFSRSLICEINVVTFLIIGFIFTPEAFIVCKKAWRPRIPGLVNFDIPF